MSELHWMGVRELAGAIAARRVSPVEVVRAHLARIEQRDGRLKCFLAVFADAALEAAHSAEAALVRGEKLGPLHGVPVAVKDLYDVQGTPTTAGSRFVKTPAAADCSVVSRLRSAGAIILGKLNLHEFAYGPEGINVLHGTPWNPWDAKMARMPGGSSSGSGVAVAAGLIPMGMGSDTGGSIRIPAAYCGTVGLKPTYGRVSRAGVFPLSWSLDHAGPLTRTVEDAAAVLAVIAGHDPADPTASKLPVPDYVAALEKPVKPLRLGLVRDYLEQADEEVQSSIRSAVKVFESLGCEVYEVQLPRSRYSLAVAAAVLGSEAIAFHEPMLKRHAADYAVDVRRRLAVNLFLTARDYLNGQRARRLLRDEVNDVFERVDCLLTPTLPTAAPPLDADELRIGQRTENVRTALTMFTRLFNLTGHPALCLPCGFNRAGLPLSLQLVGRAFDEGTILRLAHGYESATKSSARRPQE